MNSDPLSEHISNSVPSMLTICRGVEDEVIDPLRVGLEWRERPGPTGPDATPGPLFGQLQARTTPDSMRARLVECHALVLQDDANASVVIPRILPHNVFMASMTGVSLAGLSNS